MKPYCFVITSFSQKPNIKDLQAKYESKNYSEPVQTIDFDKIYKDLVEPAIQNAGMEPLIEHEEQSHGVVHKTMYEKIILCEFCVADLTNVNPNAYYELGMRYAVRPFTTIPMIASSHFPLPFDVGFDRTFVYKVDKDFNLSDKENDIKRLSAVLQKAKEIRQTDSPLYDLVNGISFQNSVAHEKTDIFRQKVIYNEKIKQDLAYARSTTDPNPVNTKKMRIEAIHKVVEANKPLQNVETGVIIDMLISYRNIEAFEEMMAFIRQMPRYVFETTMVQEQYAFVLNRNGSKKKPVDEVMIKEAEDVLKKLEANGKASSESYGIWGRIHKDKFERAYSLGNKGEAKTHLKNALKYYEKGFEFDPRDAYPGVNYITCLELLGEKQKALRLVPAVEYAVKTKMKRKDPDYWDYATLLELAVIEDRFSDAEEHYYEAKPLAIESWMFGTTKANLDKITNYRKERGEDTLAIEKLSGMLKQD
jgi:tetratricopeptide (TPR) repeat protein